MQAVARAFRRSPFDREIMRLGLPALGALAADPLVSLVDTAYVGRLGTESLGALALAAAVFGVSFSVFNFLSYGTTPLVAREIGRGDGTAAGRIAAGAVVLAALLGVVAMTILLLAPRPLLGALGAGPELMEPATTYLRIRSLALPAVLLITVGNGVFRGGQDTRTPFIIALAFNAVNLVLDPILIFGFDFGLAGAAWATVIAQWLGTIGFVVALRVRHASMGLHYATPTWTDVRELSTAGRDLILRTASLLVAFTVTTAVAARLGAVQVAAHQVALQLFIFLSLVLDAVAISAQAMLGKAMGSGDVVAIRWQADRFVGLGTMAGALLAAVLLGLGPWLPGWFTNDPAVIEQIRSVYPQLALIQLIGGAVFAWDGIVIGATDFRWALVATAIPAAVVTLLLVPMAPLDAPLSAVWWAVVLMMGLRAVLLAWWHHNRLDRIPA